MNRALLAAAVALMVGCPATAPEPTVRDQRAPEHVHEHEHEHEGEGAGEGEGEGEGAGSAELLADGEACGDSAQCASGVCEGPGCEQGTCAPSNRACTRDLRPYCGCDGQVFRTSGNCPGRLFASRGECTGAAAGARANGESCLAAAECASGICEGHGCGADQPGTCMAKDRICTTDLRQYCGCDGQTFGGSSSCPGRRFRDRKACQ